MEPPRRLLLAVDVPSLLHRNHHARVELRLRDRGGRPAWALHGMLRQILEAIDHFAPDLPCCSGSTTADVRAGGTTYPGYKAGRPEKHPALIDQLERAAALLDAFGPADRDAGGLEADDVSASAAAWAERRAGTA